MGDQLIQRDNASTPRSPAGSGCMESTVSGLLQHRTGQQWRHRAINGIIELHRRIARGFRNPINYRLRMILAAGKLTHPNLR